MYRQGDVLIISQEQLPENVNETNNRVLAEGEVTGHAHRLTGQVNTFATAEEVYFETDSGAILTHEEHADLEIPEGVYKVIIQREFDVLEGVRQVQD